MLPSLSIPFAYPYRTTIYLHHTTASPTRGGLTGNEGEDLPPLIPGLEEEGRGGGRGGGGDGVPPEGRGGDDDDNDDDVGATPEAGSVVAVVAMAVVAGAAGGEWPTPPLPL